MGCWGIGVRIGCGGVSDVAENRGHGVGAATSVVGSLATVLVVSSGWGR